MSDPSITPEPSDDAFEAWLDKAYPTWRYRRYHGGTHWHRQREAFRAGVATHNTVSQKQIAEAIASVAEYRGISEDNQAIYETDPTKAARAVLALLVPTSKSPVSKLLTDYNSDQSAGGTR